MEVVNLYHDSFFDTFDGNFANKIFRSRVRQFDYEGKDTLLSIKMALRLPEFYYSGDKSYVIRSCEYVVINPKEHIICSQNSDEVVDGISIFLDHQLVMEVYEGWMYPERVFDDPRCPFMPAFDESVKSLRHDTLGLFLSRLWNARTAYRLRSDGFFFHLAEQLVRTQFGYTSDHPNISAVRESTKQEIASKLHSAREFMHDTICEKIGIPDIAAYCGMTTYRFIRHFRSAFGCTPYQYVLRLKVRRAMQLLRQHELTITHIAETLAFADSTAFSKRFKAMTGKTPSAFRVCQNG